MERLFLSYHYDEAGKRLADLVQDLVASHGLLVVSGERLGGGALSRGIKEKIQDCDALFCLLTEREPELNRNWVRDERAFADGASKRVLSIVQNGSSDGGMYGADEQVRYDPGDPLPAFLKLSGIIGEWRRKGGRFVPALLMPTEIGETAHKAHAKVEYRLWERDQKTDWYEAGFQKTGHRETVAFLKGVPETAQVEVRLSHNGKVWESGARDQLLSIRLEPIDDA
jgi:hypothetical protein